jgi:uncharacterized membrane protein YheB (UPF0754 family)
MDFVKTWIMPPLIGAVIGYFTNWLAIKMLFRPYKTVRIAGIRLPFTPGILPREKDKLAVSLGETLAQELLTPEVITKRIQSPEIQTTTAKAIRTALEGFLAQDAERLFASQRASVDATPPDGVDESSLSLQMMASLRRLAASADIQASLRGIFVDFLASLGECQLRDVVSKEQFVGVITKVASAGQQGSSPSAGSDEKPNARLLLRALVDLPPDGTIRALTDALVPRAYEFFLPHIDDFLHNDAFKARLEAEALAFVRRALDRLGTFQRLFVSIAGYDAKIAQTMPETIEDLIQTIERVLKDPSTPQRISEALCAALIDQRTKTDAPFVPGADRWADRNVLDAALGSLRASSEELRQRAEQTYDRLAGLQIKKLIGFSISAKDASDVLLSAFVRTVEHEPDQSSTTIGAVFVQVLRESARGKTIAEFFGIRSEELEHTSLTLANALLRLLETRMPSLVAALDIPSMVSEKIDSLDMKEVERIVLKVVKKELAWITWLGGILGAIIGFIQSILSIL